jgi:predicted Zn-dependent protease
MTLAERKRIWAKRKEAKRRLMIKKITGTASVLALALASVLFAVFITAGKAEAKEEKTYYKYTTMIEVMPGDTLTSIAKDHLEGYRNVNEYIEEVRFMNQLRSNETLVAGDKLFIPYYSTEVK